MTTPWLTYSVVKNGKLLRSGTKHECLLLAILFYIMLEVLTRAIWQEKEVKCFQIEKEEVKWSLIEDDIILCIENPKESTKNF